MDPNIFQRERCEMYEICEQFDNVFNLCDAGTITSDRCSPAEKANIYLLFKIAKKLDALDIDE